MPLDESVLLLRMLPGQCAAIETLDPWPLQEMTVGMSEATDAVDVGYRLPPQHEIACAAQAVTALAQARGGNGRCEDGESVRLALA